MSSTAGSAKKRASSDTVAPDSSSPPAKRAAVTASSSPHAQDEAIERPKLLRPGSQVEALDTMDLWFPAQIVECTKTQVLVSFDGWKSQWDEWLPRNSPRLREHRGWGTPKKPDDYQIDSTIEALDMEGRWYASRVLHVSEESVMVHYNRWSSKWDEWIDKDSGRLRPLSSGGSQLDGERTESHEDVCSACEEPGELICCDGRCKRAFHLRCIPPNNPPPPAELRESTRWLCADCRVRRYRCFLCKRWGAERVDVHRCSKRQCGKAYHAECLVAALHPFGADLPPMLISECQPVSRPSSLHKNGNGRGPTESSLTPTAADALDCEEDDDGDGAFKLAANAGARGAARAVRPLLSSPLVLAVDPEADDDVDDEGEGEETWLESDHEWIHRRVRRFFDGEPNDGTLMRWIPATRTDCALWHMLHDDGDEEDLDAGEVRAALRAYDNDLDDGPERIDDEQNGDGDRTNEPRVASPQGGRTYGCCTPVETISNLSGSSHSNRSPSPQPNPFGWKQQKPRAPAAVPTRALPSRAKDKNSLDASSPAAPTTPSSSTSATPLRATPRKALPPSPAGEKAPPNEPPPPITTTTTSTSRPPSGAQMTISWAAPLICPRHWCVVCNEPESSSYGQAMMSCVRCPTSIHRACAALHTHTRLTASTFLCERCSEHTPKGLNAPDPAMPLNLGKKGAGSMMLPSDEIDSGISLADLATAKLALKATHEYDLPDDIVEALRTRQVLPTADFGPPPFATLRRSVYKHTQPRERLHEEDVSVCFCTAAGGGCDERCQNRAMLQECDPSTCPTGALCRNRPFSTLGPASRWPVQLFKTIDKGWGVMATRDIYEGELVVEYVGEVIDKASWEGRKKALWRFDHMYFMSLNQNEIVDATRKGNIARFINHSCSPNLQVEKWYVHRTPRLGLWAKRFIAAGEELSYNYSVKWSGDPEFAQRCYCGSERCTGYLGAPPRHKR